MSSSTMKSDLNDMKIRIFTPYDFALRMVVWFDALIAYWFK